MADIHNSIDQSLDFRDERYSERLRKMTVEHEKLLASTDQRVKDVRKLIETEVKHFCLTNYITEREV